MTKRTRRKAGAARRPRTADLFSGAGLLSGGFEASGFEVVYGAEADHRAIATFNLNHGGVGEQRDVRRPRTDVRCEVITAGPPCTGFSSLGKMDPSDERNSLSMAIARWVGPSGAKVVVVENVPQFLDSPHWGRLTRRMETLGFDHCAWVLDACDYGAAQRRRRSFTVYSKIGLPAEPRKSRVHRTVKDAFEGLPRRPHAEGLHVAPEPSALARRRFEMIPPQGSRADIMRRAPHLCPPSWRTLGTDVTDVWGRMKWDGPANTLRTCFQNPSKGRYIHPAEHRVITLREGARLQGVPDDWRFVGDRSSIARQIGNGVPLHLGTAVARQVRTLFT